MSAPDELLIRTADSIAAGDNVDWHGLHQQPPDPQQSRILSEMQILERIATFLRSSDTDDLSDKPTTQRPKPPMPASWSHFTIVELIGEGGFGSVYRARDTNLQTEVALKLVELPGGRELRPASALKEARLLARVRHTNVVTVHGADIVDGSVGIWMQLDRRPDALDAPARQRTVRRARSRARRRRPLPRARRRSCRRPDPRRREDAQRHARGGRANRPDGLRDRAGPVSPAPARRARRGRRRHAALPGAGSLRWSAAVEGHRHVQPRRPAVPPRDQRLPRQGTDTGRSRRGAPAQRAHEPARREVGSATVVRRPRRARAQPRTR